MALLHTYEERKYLPYLIFPFYIKADESGITIKYIIKYYIPIHEIENIEILDKVPLYIGWGLRVNPFKRKLYFLYSHKNIIKLKLRNRFWREIYVSVENPNKFVSSILYNKNK